jgi:hypothetical protein
VTNKNREEEKVKSKERVEVIFKTTPSLFMDQHGLIFSLIQYNYLYPSYFPSFFSHSLHLPKAPINLNYLLNLRNISKKNVKWFDLVKIPNTWILAVVLNFKIW